MTDKLKRDEWVGREAVCTYEELVLSIIIGSQSLTSHSNLLGP
jgi:hypothetical protein